VNSRAERLLLTTTPLATMAVVALALRLGAQDAVRAAVVYGAPMAGAGTGLAWQVVVFDEDRGQREPVALPDVEVIARTADGESRWHGPTNADGVAEALLGLPRPEGVRLEVKAGNSVLARGEARIEGAARSTPSRSSWARFARREGQIELDVAVLGERVASGFPAILWVRATDVGTRAAVRGAVVEPETDASLTTATSTAITDARGWATITATPMGHTVGLVLRARAGGGRTGEWAGGLFVSPGASQLSTRNRWAPDEAPELEIVVPTVRTTAYVEVDDARGRVWAAALSLPADVAASPRARVRAPRLVPGLYWAVASGDPQGAARLGPGTIVRPFFVAATDEAALSFGTDAAECAKPRDPAEAARVASVCLALAGATPLPRWTALDGFSAGHAMDAQKRARGLTIALGAILVAVLLETMLLLRAASRSRARLGSGTPLGDGVRSPTPGRAGTLAIGLLVALLGFALLAALLVRMA